MRLERHALRRFNTGRKQGYRVYVRGTFGAATEFVPKADLTWSACRALARQRALFLRRTVGQPLREDT